jgi:hypothetical protein
MENKEFTQTAALIARDFELEASTELLTEAELLQLLADQIAYMIDHRLEFLLSLMYRLDIDESRVSAALSPASEEPANLALARLVLDRQKQRVFTKQYYKQQNPDNWNWEE